MFLVLKLGSALDDYLYCREYLATEKLTIGPQCANS